jgi:transposase
MVAGSRLEEIVDEESELVLERVAAIDVAKASGMVAVRGPHPSIPGRRKSTVWPVPATTREIIGLAERLVAQQIQKVTIESTSDYWRIWFYLLQVAGLDVQLVNARDVKNVPGRPKTDKLDAVWLAKLTEKGLLRASFVPPVEVRVLRHYTRMRADLVHERTRYWQRLEKLLEDALIKLSSVASTLETVSARAMIEALIGGQRDPQVLAGLARGRMKVKHAALVEALTGRFEPYHADLARMLLEQIDALDVQIDKLTARAAQAIAAIAAAAAPVAGTDSTDSGDGGDGDGRGAQGNEQAPARMLSAVDRLAEIPGISPDTARTILGEIGLDMSVFPTAAQLTSWAKLTPRTMQSGTRNKNRKTDKGNPYLKAVLGQAAVGAAKTDTFLGERYRRLIKRRGKAKAQVAVARSILVIIWHLLANPTTRYRDLGPDHHTTRVNTARKIRSLVHQLEVLGHQVTLQPAA